MGIGIRLSTSRRLLEKTCVRKHFTDYPVTNIHPGAHVDRNKRAPYHMTLISDLSCPPHVGLSAYCGISTTVGVIRFHARRS